MKKVYSLLLASLLFVSVSHAVTKTWNGGTGAALNWTTAGNWLPVGAPAGGDDVVFNTAGTLTFTTGPGASFSFNSLTVSAGTVTIIGSGGSRTFTLGGAAGVDFSISSGATLVMSTNLSITMAANATATIDGSLTVNTGRTFNTNNAGVVTTVNGTINNTGTVTSTAAARLLMQSGSTYTHSQNGGNIPTATWNAASNCNITGVTGTEPTNDTQTFGNFTWNCAGQGTNQLQFSGSITTTGTFSVTNTGTVGSGRLELGNATNSIAALQINGGTLRIGSNTARALTVSGNVTISSGTLLMTSGNNVGTLNVAGNFSHTGGTIDETGTGSGAIIFNGSGAQTFTSGGTVSNTINYTVNSGAIVNMASAGTVVTGAAFTVASGGTLGITSTDGIVTAPTASGNIQTTARTFNTGGNYLYIGSAAQVTGNALPATVNNFTINNAAGLSLSQNLAIAGTLTFTSGDITSTTTNKLTINDGAGVTGASNSSNVDGPMTKLGNDDFTFPVGDPLGSYHPIRVNNTAGANGDSYTAEYFRASATALGSVASPLYGVSNCEYWVLSRDAGGSTPNIFLSWTADSPCGGNSYTNSLTGLTVARLTAGVWGLANGANQAATGSVGVGGNGTVADNGVSLFGTLALGNTEPEVNPLPVKIGSIKAYEKAAGVQIDWTAFTEINAEKYVIERSANGQQFTAVGEVAARNLSIASDYGFFDPNPLPGISFYRLRNLDQDGKSGYSNIVRVNLSKDGKSVIVYPNPVRAGGYLSYGSAQLAKGIYTARIFNAAGQQVYNQQFAHAGGAINQTIQLPAGMKAGLYAMQLNNEEITVSSRTFIVQ